MPSYDPRRPLARHSRTLLIASAALGAVLTLTVLYYRTGDSEPRLNFGMRSGGFKRPPSEQPRAIDSPYWSMPETGASNGLYHVFLVENYNRTNVIEMTVPVRTSIAEFKQMATEKLAAPFEVTWYSASRSTSYLHNDAGPLENILKESNKFVWTRPKELFRRVNGAFVYLWTSEQAKPARDGNHDKTDMMRESVERLVLFFQKYEPYPVIMFHDLPQEVRNKVTLWFKNSTIIHWVSVADQFPFQQLPDLPLLREKNLTGPGIKGVHTPCSNRVWATGYLQMIRFRVLGTWQQEIIHYFDYIQQIDTDITIVRADFDPFQKTHELDAVLGFYHCEVDHTCADGLHEWILDYAQKNGLKWRFLENIYHELVYSVNFATLKTSFFLYNPEITKLYHAYVNTGYIETRRWTEQVLYPYVLALFTDYDRVYTYGDHIALTHYRQPYPPRLQCVKKPFFCCGHGV